MPNKTEVQEIVTKIQDLTWDDLEVAEDQPQEPIRFEGLGVEAAEMHQYIRNEMRRRGLSPCEPEVHEEPEIPELTIDWRKDTLCYYDHIVPTKRMLEIARDAKIANTALDPERLGVECMDAYREGLIQNTTLNDFRGLRAAIRDLADSVMANFDTFFKACSLLFEVRVLCVWDEFIWKMKNKIKRQHGMEAWEIHLTDHLLEGAWHPGMTEVEWADIQVQNHAHLVESELGALDLGTLTEEEAENFRAQWLRYIRRGDGTLAFCTPSRSRLTGRQ